MSKVVTFVGGPLDLTRASVETERRRYEVPILNRPMGIGAFAEGSLPSPAEVSFSTATYLIETAFTREGKEVHVGIFQGTTEAQSQTAEIKRLRTSLENERIQHRLDVEALVDTRDDLKKKLADAVGRLSSIGNVLSAKEPQTGVPADGKSFVVPVKSVQERRLAADFGCRVPCTACDRNFEKR